MHCHRPKKVVQHPTQENYSREMNQDASEFSSDVTLNIIPFSTSPMLKEDNILPSTNTEQVTSISAFECFSRSEEFNAISYSGDENEILQSMTFRKSQSLGSGLDREGSFSCYLNINDKIEQVLPSDNSQDGKFGEVVNSFHNSCIVEACGCDDFRVKLLNKNQANMFEINTDSVFSDPIFSIEGIKQLDNDFYEWHAEELPSHDVVEVGHINTQHAFSNSCSLPRHEACASSLACGTMGHRSMSVGNLRGAELWNGVFNDQGRCNSRESFPHFRDVSSCHDMSQASDATEKRLHSEVDSGEEHIPSITSKECMEMQGKEELMTGEKNNDFINNDVNTSHNFIASVNDWRECETNIIRPGNIQEEPVIEPWHELDSEDFHTKRIREWIQQIDIHDNSMVQEVGESSNAVSKVKKNSHLISGFNSSKPDVRGSGGAAAAYSYISLLTPASTSAQMANLGLVVIPFLSVFSSLRVLNLSGNAIVRITSGALPRGLHVLNLSRNSISIIEGLRELTRLRILDLSYNRIFRIGHGLAACSSLKELYLGGNKIGEVEGLHRLLKLNVLDLQFNKISTAKSLGQLAANYSSLQAINLEGNPAERNMGDDQLKRYIHGLLPRLVYFNKHIIRTSSTKELSDRPSRSATSHQYDRGMRTDHKRTRRGHQTAVSNKVTSSLNHFKGSQAMGSLPKLPRQQNQHVQLLTPGSKAHHLPRTSRKLLSSLQTMNPLRRSHSEGNF